MKAKKAAAIKKAAPVKKAAAKKAVVKKAAPAKKAASAKKVVIKKVAPKKVAAKKATTKKVVSKKAAAKKTIRREAAPLAVAAITVLSSHIIPKLDGQVMVSKFSQSMSNLSSITFNRGIQFDKSLFEQLLQLSNVAKIRLYNAVNSANEHTLVVTAADANNNDIYFKIPASNATARTSQFLNAPAPGDDGVGDMGTKCPAYDPSVTAL
jgi:hypothetical protein